MGIKGWILFWISIAISLAIWGWLQSPEFAVVIVFGIAVHEYGHYWQMGREGICERKMMMIPPLGAIAISGYWLIVSIYMGIIGYLVRNSNAKELLSYFWK